MNNIDKFLRILWISDIHYRVEYCVDEDIQSLISSFLKYVKKIQYIEEYDYLLISGDIANLGKKIEYNLFIKKILLPLQEILPSKTQLLIIPGNHDVNWDNVKESNIKDQFIKSLANREDRYKLLDEIDFRNFFKDYSDAFLNVDKSPKSNYNIPTFESDLIKNKLLFGYVLNLSKKTIIILLNSSWYSIGDDLIRKYIEDLINKHNNSLPIDNEVNSIIEELKLLSNEHGEQLLGLIKFDLDALSKILTTYNDFIVISVMHHAKNWLNWDERLKQKSYYFNKEIEVFSDLLLTGHEHVPIEQKINYENDNQLIHIPSGCFLDEMKIIEDSKARKVDLSNSWFSSIIININKRTIQQLKHFYDIPSKEWKHSDIEPYRKLNKKYNSLLSEERKKLLQKCSFNFINYIKTNYCHKNNAFLTNISDNVCVVNNILYILASSFKVVDFNYNIIDLKKWIVDNKIEVVSFTFLDKDHNLFEEYSLHDKYIVLNKIKDDLDFLFDKFRHYFFSSVIKEISSYKELKFISKVIPYWVIEDYIENN